MNFKNFNERFKDKWSEVVSNKPLKESFQVKLKEDLENEADKLVINGTPNINDYTIAFQGVLKNHAPDDSWWEVTDVDIYQDLFQNNDVQGCINRIIDNLTPKYKDNAISESIDYAKQLVDIAKKDNKNISYKDAKEVIDQSFNDKVDDIETFYRNLDLDSDTTDEGCKKNKDDKKSLNESIGINEVVDVLLHKYEEYHDKEVPFDEDIFDFIDRVTIYSSDCLNYFNKEPREMFMYGMQHCIDNDSYTKDFDDFVRGAIEDLVAENLDKFKRIYDGEKEVEDKKELDTLRNK